ncbi:glycosyltransferase [Rhodanobacter sp. C01]|uniref:glycosyltransferase n=1 Tax=Rhodanobacter sp. C01 TaxID=1945856 RepID=UPI0020C52573|nr:glycosyltransferase [Rhodanobacter sp. C01]
MLASTYPRWSGDPEPGFVHELAKRLTDQFHVIALVPGAHGATARETLDGVEVIRYRYAPQRFQTLVNDGGIVTNLRRHRWKLLLIPPFVLAQAWQTWRLLRTRRIDVIHAHWLLPQGLITAFLGKLSRRLPSYLVTSHGADLFALRGRCLNALKRLVVRRAAAVTVVSEAMRRELARIGADASKVNIQPMGVDLEGLFTPSSAVQRSHDEILFVGRLVEKKGLHYLIDAMPEILRDHPTAYLTIAGFGPEKESLAEQIQRLGLQAKVQFIGAVSQVNLPALYRRAAVFVAPFVQAVSGDQEGLGLVTVEAAGCGCPVVASDLPSVRDVFGVTRTQLIAPGSAKAISEAVNAILIEAPTHDDAVQVRASLCARFDWTVVVESYAQILRRVAESRLDKV